jgi:phosphoribosylglycinamide formyltransferase-1
MILFVGKNASHLKNFLNKKFDIKKVFTNRGDSEAFKMFQNVSIDSNLEEDLKKYENELIVLAGYLKIIPEKITKKYNIINIHPSILPFYKGLNALERSFISGKATGITIHKVNENLDEGEVIFKKEISIKGLTLNEYKSILKKEEFFYYPKVVKDIQSKKSLR